MQTLDPPKAPSNELKLQCLYVLSRLRLIPEISLWLEQAYFYHERSLEQEASNSAFRVVWICVALGAPLDTLLDTLGPLPSSTVDQELVEETSALTLIGQQRLFTSFVKRVQLLEIQGKLPYGEVLRLDDLVGRTCSGFSKILRTIERVLIALQESFPGLYVLPSPQPTKQHALIQELKESERSYICILESMLTGSWLTDKTMEWSAPLECLIVHLSRFLVYHQHVFQNLEALIDSPLWDHIFALDSPVYTKAMGTYRSCCSSYLNICELFEGRAFGLDLEQGLTLCDTLSTVLSRVSHYSIILQEILGTINPAESPACFDSLCRTIFQLLLVSDNLDEIGRTIRAMRASSILKSRAFSWNGLDPSELGTLLLDDQLFIGCSGENLAVFLFESMLLVCREGVGEQATSMIPSSYPIVPWEMGPALRRGTLLNIVHAIPVSRLSALRCFEHDSFELDWYHDESSTVKSLISCRLSSAQCNQWCTVLRPFVSTYYCAPELTPGQEPLFSNKDILPEVTKRTSRPRSWSVIGRKGPHSETSSFIQQERLNEAEYPLSPGLLPTLFNTTLDGLLSPRSNKSSSRLHPSDGRGLALNVPPTLPLDRDFDDVSIPNLTGQIVKEGTYPSAGGGFADVWKATWNWGPRPEDQIKVAVKALRSRIDDADREERMKRSFIHELNVWKKLDHKHVIRLLGTASDFGHYSAMVCPWYEHGSVSRYMEKYGDILSITDRLQLLCQVASGLAYLHSFNIVHGDLTGSNILINDKGEACLCDFGLSSIVVEFQNSSSALSTLGVGGSVRWADAKLFIATLPEDGSLPPLTTSNDIYSFGSVMLEILSGRIPYHYIRTDAQVVIELYRGNKPRRPSDCFVTDAQWEFIQRCWGNEMEERPHVEEVCIAMKELHKQSLEHRRYTA